MKLGFCSTTQQESVNALPKTLIKNDTSELVNCIDIPWQAIILHKKHNYLPSQT